MAQYFNGEAYWLCGHYYQRRGRRLHRAVWEHHNGPVPSGFHVHHKDGDRSNNDIANLELQPAVAHLRHHANQPDRLAYAKWHMDTRMRPAAAEWHRSEEGRRWHSEHAKANAKLGERFPFVCVVCGKEGKARRLPRVYCSDACYQRAFRRRNPGYYAALKKRKCVQPARSGDE